MRGISGSGKGLSLVHERAIIHFRLRHISGAIWRTGAHKKIVFRFNGRPFWNGVPYTTLQAAMSQVVQVCQSRGNDYLTIVEAYEESL